MAEFITSLRTESLSVARAVAAANAAHHVAEYAATAAAAHSARGDEYKKAFVAAYKEILASMTGELEPPPLIR